MNSFTFLHWQICLYCIYPNLILVYFICFYHAVQLFDSICADCNGNTLYTFCLSLSCYFPKILLKFHLHSTPSHLFFCPIVIDIIFKLKIPKVFSIYDIVIFLHNFDHKLFKAWILPFLMADQICIHSPHPVSFLFIFIISFIIKIYIQMKIQVFFKNVFKLLF